MFRVRLFGIQNWGPVKQGIFSLVLSVLLGVIALATGTGIEMIFNLVIAPALLFCFMNPMIAMFTPRLSRYFIWSLVVFILLVVANYWLARMFTGISPFSNNTMALMYVLMVTFFFMVYSAGMIFRGVRLFLEKSDQIR